MIYRWMLILSLLAGCAALPAVVLPPTTTLIVPAERILVQIEPVDCACNLSDVDFALLELPYVSQLEWDAANSRVWLIFLDDRRPTDEQIRHAMENTPVKLKQIYRP